MFEKQLGEKYLQNFLVGKMTLFYGTEKVYEIVVTWASYNDSFMTKCLQFCKLNLIMLVEM
jgi:hypothetical protein